jgi:hypothetical protein
MEENRYNRVTTHSQWVVTPVKEEDKRKEFFDQVSRYQFLKSRPVPKSYLFDNHLFPLSENSRSTDKHELYNWDMSV